MKINNKIDERRRHPRFETTLPLEIKTGDFDIVTSTKNISCSGAYCQINRYLAPMTKLNIALALNNQGREMKVKCKGVVVRSDPALVSEKEQKYNIAIFFNDISESEKEKLTNFINTRLSV